MLQPTSGYPRNWVTCITCGMIPDINLEAYGCLVNMKITEIILNFPQMFLDSSSKLRLKWTSPTSSRSDNSSKTSTFMVDFPASSYGEMMFIFRCSPPTEWLPGFLHSYLNSCIQIGGGASFCTFQQLYISNYIHRVWDQQIEYHFTCTGNLLTVLCMLYTNQILFQNHIRTAVSPR